MLLIHRTRLLSVALAAAAVLGAPGTRTAGGDSSAFAAHLSPDFSLILTGGATASGREAMRLLNAPVTIVSLQSRGNHHALRRLPFESGATYTVDFTGATMGTIAAMTIVAPGFP